MSLPRCQLTVADPRAFNCMSPNMVLHEQQMVMCNTFVHVNSTVSGEHRVDIYSTTVQ
ncbi:hypothetical protein PoB_007241300, partial [Plakobranchus ocellatus]